MNSHNFHQAHREALIALILSLIFLGGWVLGAYFAPQGFGWLGFPWWFEISCIYLPFVFVTLIGVVIKFFFQDLDLSPPNS